MTCWGLWDQNVAPNQIIEPGYTLCWSAKWLGQEDILFSSLHSQSKQEMLYTIYQLLEEADAVVHYNGTKFDMPTLNKEFVSVGLNPPSPYKQIDLLRTVKDQFKFPSNKLDYIAKVLGLGQKHEHKGHELWLECMRGEEEAWQTMKTYNIQDVILLEKLYIKLKPWIKNHPNVGLYEDHEKPSCPTCGSQHVVKRGKAFTSLGIYTRYRCSNCGKWSRSRKSEKTIGKVPLTNA